MSRPIRYRAWGKNSKEYLGDSSQGFNMEELSRLSGQFANWELEQYTGLKDKNGKEIYEGDIVDKAYHNIETYDKNGVVEMGYLCDSDGYNNEEIYGWKAGDSSLADVCEVCEVIGNIHENPELLGGKE